MSDYNPPADHHSDSDSSHSDIPQLMKKAVTESFPDIHAHAIASNLIGDVAPVKPGEQTFEAPIVFPPSFPVSQPNETFPTECPFPKSKTDSPTESQSCSAECIPQPVRDLFLWKSPLHTGIIFGSLLVLELSLACHSVISVAAYLGLAVMAISLGYKLYGQFIGECTSCSAMNCFFNKEWHIPEECAEKMTRQSVAFLNKHLGCIRDRFLLKNYTQAFKFALFLYFLTYVGAFFNLLTLIIIGTVELFVLPVIYVTYKREIDHYLKCALHYVKENTASIREKLKDLPFIGPKLKGE